VCILAQRYGFFNEKNEGNERNEEIIRRRKALQARDYV